MEYLRELRWTALVAVVAFVPLTGLGFALLNPHGSGNIARIFLGYFLLLPIMALHQVADTYPIAANFMVLGFAQFVWSWLLVLVLRVSYVGMTPLWSRSASYVRASRARRVTAALLASALVAVGLFPTRSVTVPSWRLQFVDTTGQPFANIPVRQHWEDSGVEFDSHVADAVTNAEGYVEFPERSLTTIFVAYSFARTLYPEWARHSYINQLCDLFDYGSRGADYAGQELPSQVTLRYFSRESIRRSMNLPENPACAVPESQAKAADASSGLRDAR